MEEFTDRYLDKPKQDVINTFKQGHLIKAYSKLESEQRMALLSQMELIQFDMIDMVADAHQVYHRQIKDEAYWYKDVAAVNIPKSLYLKEAEYQSKEHFSKGLDFIASGKLAIMLHTGYFSNVKTSPRCLQKPTWAHGMTLLEYFIKKIKSIGEYGSRRSRSEDRQRQEVREAPRADHDLPLRQPAREQRGRDLPGSQQVLRLHGLARLPDGTLRSWQDIVPNLDQQGKILFRDSENISFSSIGSGAFFQCLKRDGLLSHMSSSSVETLQIVNMNHVTAELAKPQLVGYLSENKKELDMVSEVSEYDYLQMNPVIIMDEPTQRLYYADHFSISRMKDPKGNAFVPETQLHSTNVYLQTEFLGRSLNPYRSEIFRYLPLTSYGIKERTISVLDQGISNTPSKHNVNIPKFYTFEFNLFNLLKALPRIKFLFVEKKDVRLAEQIVIDRGMRDVTDASALSPDEKPSRLFARPQISQSMKEVVDRFILRHNLPEACSLDSPVDVLSDADLFSLFVLNQGRNPKIVEHNIRQFMNRGQSTRESLN